MAKIRIVDLEVFLHVGVPEAERAKPQRLLLNVEMEHDFTHAAQSDRLENTIDYHQVVIALLHFGDGKSWKLIERLATDAAEMILATFGPRSVTVEVKKFVIPQASYVSVLCTRSSCD